MTLWPAPYNPHEFRLLLEKAGPAAHDWLTAHTGGCDDAALKDAYLPLALQVHHWREALKPPLLLGLSGAQGSGKSTLAKLLQVILERGYGYRVVSVSLDDLYLPHSRRQDLGRKVHPLFATRGVPGTHDVELGLTVLSQLKSLGPDQSLRLPRFDKAADDRLGIEQWETVTGPLDVILFEGWCLGARPRLVYLQAPSWESVYLWRRQQEHQLAAAAPEGAGGRIMDDAQLRRFVAHYERLTRLMLATMPHRADIWLELDGERAPLSIHLNAKA